MLCIQDFRKSALLIVVWATIAAGCGIKGPPVAPERTPPEAVADLQAVVEGETIRMDWSVNRSAAEGAAALKGFYVFRWQNPIEEPVCPGCPKVFERIADVDMDSGKPGEDNRLLFSVEARLLTGYRYTFKVIGYGRGGLRSGDSNLLSFDY